MKNMSSDGYHDRYYENGYYQGSMADWIIGLVFCVCPAIIFFAAIYLLKRAVTGYNIITSIIFFVALLLFVPGFVDRKRFSALRRLKKKKSDSFSGTVWRIREYSDTRVGDDTTWYGKKEKDYCISFYDKEYGSKNASAVRATMARTSRIIWVSTETWMILAGICAVLNLFLYELVVPLFRRSNMAIKARDFFEVLFFILPSVLALLFAVLNYVYIRIKDKLLYECAVRAVNDNKAEEQKQRIERNIDRNLSKKWYYNNCPNCGAEVSYSLKSCSHCGTSLEVKSFEGGTAGAIHRLEEPEAQEKS